MDYQRKRFTVVYEHGRTSPADMLFTIERTADKFSGRQTAPVSARLEEEAVVLVGSARALEFQRGKSGTIALTLALRKDAGFQVRVVGGARVTSGGGSPIRQRGAAAAWSKGPPFRAKVELTIDKEAETGTYDVDIEVKYVAETAEGLGLHRTVTLTVPIIIK